MASLHSVSSHPSVDQGPNIDLETAQLYAIHQGSLDGFDFATPLLALMRKARNKMELSGPEKRAWVLESHGRMIELAYAEGSLKREISLASAASLLDSIFAVSERVSLLLREPSAFFTYSSSNTEVFTHQLIQKLSPVIRQKNIIPMIEMIYWMKFYYLHGSNLEDLCDAAFKKAFPQQVPTDGIYAAIISAEEREIYVQLAPIVLHLFHEVSISYFSLSPPTHAKKGSEDCCSSCICQ